ncbi:hypothetical protein [Dactylosporangium sp. CS-033363]|uniref:hypothetical protein n=1 Tax=Dactylosporangium sp. CS-033363 TaxID=3239935 RepID=UPI003D8E3B66
MGSTFEVVVDVEATPGEAPALADAVLRWLAAEGVAEADGLETELGRTVFWPPLDPGFVRELGHRLGHRVVVTRGKV